MTLLRGFGLMLLISLLGGISTPSQAAGGMDAAHAGKRGRRGRRFKPQYENFTGVKPVTEVQLSNYNWLEVEDTIDSLLEAALGPEVAYWKGRGVSCNDIALTVRDLHSIFLHSVRVVLIRNQTWHFLNPARPGGSSTGHDTDDSGGRGAPDPVNVGARQRDRSSLFDWPLLVPSPPDTCSSPCQAQLRYFHGAIAGRLAGWRSATPRGPSPPRYQLPDMVFVINAADNMQRFGAGSRAPVLSLMKWWRVPWSAPQQTGGLGAKASGGSSSGGGDASSAVSLGRVGGALLQPLGLPSDVARRRAAMTAAPGSSSTGPDAAVVAGDGATGVAEAADAADPGPGADPLLARVRRFVAERPLELPPGVEADQQPRRRRRRKRRAGGTEEQVYEIVKEDPLQRPYDMDLLLPTMTFAPRSLSFFPWELKKDIAFFRGIAFCPLYPDLHPICPRALLANVTAAGWFPADLDVRLVRRFRGRLGSRGQYRNTVVLPGSRPTAPRDHARFRYLLNMDGLSGSTRMGVLMATDSVILKSRSPFIEYYSRLQVPGAHYLEFWKDPVDPLDLLQVLKEARSATAQDPEGARAAAEANQAIAARYIAMEPKLIYARAALLTYHSLVADMDSCVRDLVAHLEASGHPLQEPWQEPGRP